METTKKQSVVDTAKIVEAAEKHAKQTRSQLKAAQTALEKAQERNEQAEAELARSLEDHRQAIRQVK